MDELTIRDRVAIAVLPLCISQVDAAGMVIAGPDGQMAMPSAEQAFSLMKAACRQSYMIAEWMLEARNKSAIVEGITEQSLKGN